MKRDMKLEVREDVGLQAADRLWLAGFLEYVYINKVFRSEC